MCGIAAAVSRRAWPLLAPPNGSTFCRYIGAGTTQRAASRATGFVGNRTQARPASMRSGSANASGTSHTAQAGHPYSTGKPLLCGYRCDRAYVPGPPREACPNDWRIGACVCLAQVVESPPGCLGRTETAALGASCPGFWENSRCITRDGSAKSNAPERRGFGRACVHTRGETPLAGSGGTAATGSVFARRRSQTLWGGSGAILPSECLLSSCPAFCRCRT